MAGTAVYKIGNVVVLFLLTALLSRAMGVDGYGVFSLLILNASLFNLFTSFGTDSGITYAVALDVRSVNRVVSLLLLVLVLQLVLLFTVEAVSFFSTGRWWLLKSSNKNGLWLGVIFLVSLSMQEKFAALLNGSHFYVQVNRTVFVANLVTLFIIAFFFLFKQGDAQFYLLVYILLSLLQAFLLSAVARNRLSFSFQLDFSRQALRLFFRYSALAFFINCIQFLAYRVDFWLIDFYKSETDLGLYALAVRLVQLFWILPVLFASILLPKVSSATMSKEEWTSMLRLLNAFNLLAGIAAFFCIKPFVFFFFGDAYSFSVPAFQILLPGIVLFANAVILAAYFAGKNQLKINLYGSLLCLFCVGLLDVLLIPSQGYLGAAVASSIGYGLTSVFFLVVYQKSAGAGLSTLFVPQKEDWQQFRRWSKQFFTKQT